MNSLACIFPACFGVYAIVLYSEQKSVQDMYIPDGKCMANTTIRILLANGILDLVTFVLAVISALGFGISLWKDNFTPIHRLIDGASQGIRACIACTSFALLVAMSVYTWSFQCVRTHTSKLTF